MAIAAPVLLLIVIGLFEMGHAFMIKHLLQDAAREGCRVAVSPKATNGTVESSVNKLLQEKGIQGATMTILVNNASTNVNQAKAGDNISVTIQVNTSSVSVVPSGYLNGQLTVSSVRRRE